MNTTHSSYHQRMSRQNRSLAIKRAVKTFLRDNGVRPHKAWQSLAIQMREVLGHPVRKHGKKRSREYLELWATENGVVTKARRTLLQQTADTAKAEKQAGPSAEKQLQQRAKREARKSKKRYGDSFYSSWEWKKARFETLSRYGAVCMLCNSTERICVDHIKPRKKFPELELDLDNLQVLCNDCNMGKSNDDYTDFRSTPSSADVVEIVPRNQERPLFTARSKKVDREFSAQLSKRIAGQREVRG